MRALSLTGLYLILCVGFSTVVSAKEVAGVKVPESITVDATTLRLNGAGLRTRAILKLYVGALYLKEASTDPVAIIANEESMAIWLRIRSRLVSQEKMAKALLDGFDNATNGNTAPIQAQIDQLMSMMSEPIKKRDRFLLAWDPATTEIRVSKNDKSLGAIPGKTFKEALFGIWLSDKPAQNSLKNSMLGL